MEDIFSNPYVVKIIKSIVLTIVVLAISKIIFMISSNKKGRTIEIQHVVKYTSVLFLGVALVFIWLDSIGPVLTAFTIVAAALTLVAKEVLLNFLGSFVIFWRELFAIGDRVKIGEYSGDVIDKGLLYFTLLELGQGQSTGHSTGRMIKIPNSLAHTMPITNTSRGGGYIWNELPFSISRESDWRKAKLLLLEIADDFLKNESMDLEIVKASFEKKKIYFNTLSPKVYTSIGVYGIKLTLRYVCSSRLIHESEDFITTRFLQVLAPGVIDLVDTQ